MSEPLPLFSDGVLRAAVPLMELKTVYVRYGDWFAWLMTLISIAVIVRKGFTLLMNLRTARC